MVQNEGLNSTKLFSRNSDKEDFKRVPDAQILAGGSGQWKSKDVSIRIIYSGLDCSSGTSIFGLTTVL